MMLTRWSISPGSYVIRQHVYRLRPEKVLALLSSARISLNLGKLDQETHAKRWPQLNTAKQCTALENDTQKEFFPTALRE